MGVPPPATQSDRCRLAILHPIEHLRYVARSGGVPAAMLVEETADAVLGLSSRYGEVDPSELLTACRRILSRRPTSGPLWWMAARVLTSNDVRREIDEVLTELREDRTASELEAALGHGATVRVIVRIERRVVAEAARAARLC